MSLTGSFGRLTSFQHFDATQTWAPVSQRALTFFPWTKQETMHFLRTNFVSFECCLGVRCAGNDVMSSLSLRSTSLMAWHSFYDNYVHSNVPSDKTLNSNNWYGTVSSASIGLPSSPPFHSLHIVGTVFGSEGLLPVPWGQPWLVSREVCWIEAPLTRPQALVSKVTNTTSIETMVTTGTSPLSFTVPAPPRRYPPLLHRVVLKVGACTTFFYSFPDSSQFCFQLPNFRK